MENKKIEKVKQTLLKRDNLIILILTGILCMVIAWPIPENSPKTNDVYGLWDRNSGTINKSTNEAKQIQESFFTEEGALKGVSQETYIVEYLEKKLEDILSAMQGVGRVKVMVTLSSGGEKVIAKDIPLERNNIIENDSGGGNRSTNEMYSKEETVYSTTADGEKIPYVIKENSAVVEGVSVVAEGGENILVQKNISEVIQALFGIEEHKIKVVKMKQEE